VNLSALETVVVVSSESLGAAEISEQGVDMRQRIGVVIGLACLLATGSASAHHNMSASFDFENRVTITGPLTKVSWTNPHTYLSVESQSGETAGQAWSMEGPSPGFFRSRDIARSEFEDALNKSVTAELSRARDGSHTGLIRTITLPSGKVISLCPQNC
jgi:hypothetical protein